MLISFLAHTLKCSVQIRPGLVNVSYTWYKSLNQLLLLLRKLPQLCDSTAKTSFEMEDSLSVRTDFSSSNKRSACSKRRRIMIKMLSQPSHCQLDPMILITIAIRGRSHKLCWQEEVGRYVQKYCLFVNFYKVENVTCSGVGSTEFALCQKNYCFFLILFLFHFHPKTYW